MFIFCKNNDICIEKPMVIRMASQEAIYERREQVKKLRTMRLSLKEISTKLGWNFETILKDMKYWRGYYKSAELAEEEDVLIGFLIENDFQYQTALKILSKAERTENLPMMVKANNQMSQITKMRVEMLQDFGMCPKEPMRLDIRKTIYEVQWKKEEVTINDRRSKEDNNRLPAVPKAEEIP